MVFTKKEIKNDLKKLSQEELIDFFRLTLDSINMSAFLYHPKIGAFSITNNFEQVLALINHSKLEEEYIEVKRKISVNNWVQGENMNNYNNEKLNKPIPKYTG